MTVDELLSQIQMMKNNGDIFDHSEVVIDTDGNDNFKVAKYCCFGVFSRKLFIRLWE